MNNTQTFNPRTDVPNARIETREVDSFGETVTRYAVVDELGDWGVFQNYSAAKDRLATRKTVEKAMRTRRRNKALKARATETRS